MNQFASTIAPKTEFVTKANVTAKVDSPEFPAISLLVLNLAHFMGNATMENVPVSRDTKGKTAPNPFALMTVPDMELV